MREIPGAPGYWAGEDGNIYSTRGRITRGPKASDRYYASPPRLVKPADGRYLRVTIDGRTKNVHVLICETWHGPRPTGTQVSHLNENAHDNRPENLAWESPKQNMARRGYLQYSGERSSRAKLTDQQVEQIRELLAQGRSLSEIGRQFGVTPRHVGFIRDGEVRRQH